MDYDADAGFHVCKPLAPPANRFENPKRTATRKADSPATSGEQQPPTDTWEKYQTKYLPGDFVQTEFGPAIISEVSESGSYSIWPLPGWKWRRERWGWSPVKRAWYDDDELTLIERGAASKARRNKSPRLKEL